MALAGDVRFRVRRHLEARLRRAWRGDPGAAARLAGLLYGAGVDVRNAMYEAGLIRAERGPIPIVSIGGLTAGGSGKTPMTAHLARWLSEAGHDVAVLTHGIPDEMEVHRRLNPRMAVLGGKDRLGLARAAAGAGARIALLDAGFQHRRLARDVELVLLDLPTIAARRRLRLPAGPFRERSREAVRADAVILVTRDRDDGQLAAATRRIGEWLPRTLVAAARLIATGLVPANAAAAARTTPRPGAAVAGVMWPERFFRAVESLGERPARCLALPDHVRYEGGVVNHLLAEAGPDGVVCSLKDAVKLAPLLEERTPVWYVSEQVRWVAGGNRLRRSVLAACARLCERWSASEPGPGEEE